MTKTCFTCKQDKPFSDYHKDENKPDKHAYRCKTCVSAWWQEKRRLEGPRPKQKRRPYVRPEPTSPLSADQLKSIEILTSYYEDIAQLNRLFDPLTSAYLPD